jgi:hypothetical protein
MRRHSGCARSARGARLGAALAATAAITLSAPAAARAVDASPRWWVAIGPVAGAVRLDSHLSDYRWDAGPAATWGAQALAGRGRLAAGGRAWRARTTQAIGIPGEPLAPDVRLTGVEFVGECRVATLWGVALAPTASVGRLRIAYSPDRVAYDPFGTGDRVEVAYAPLDEWIGSAGVVARRALPARLGLALRVERSYFAIDAAHRNGAEIVEQREGFANWAARFELSWWLLADRRTEQLIRNGDG